MHLIFVYCSDYNHFPHFGLAASRQQDDNPPALTDKFFFFFCNPSLHLHFPQRERDQSVFEPSCSESDIQGFLVGDKWWSRARVVWVHGEQPWRDPKRSQGMSEVMCEEDEERLDLAPWGTTTQMAMRGNQRGSWCCRGAGQGMGTTTTTTTTELFWKCVCV